LQARFDLEDKEGVIVGLPVDLFFRVFRPQANSSLEPRFDLFFSLCLFTDELSCL
jgi:hypothetical protein